MNDNTPGVMPRQYREALRRLQDALTDLQFAHRQRQRDIRSAYLIGLFSGVALGFAVSAIILGAWGL